MSNHYNELIPVFHGTIGEDLIPVVNARDLHKFLESKQEFSNWIKNRISDYGFIEEQDYLIILSNRVGGLAGKPKTEYHITLDMAKELAMVERNAKGKQARRYFIDCEKRLLEHTPAASVNAASIQNAAPNRLALLKEITQATTRFINSPSTLERETLALSLCEMNRMAGFADKLNGKILAELSASPYADQHTAHVIEKFWKNYRILSIQENLNHSRDSQLIAVNLRYIVAACEREGLKIASLPELRRALSQCKNPAFVNGSTTVNSAILGNKSVRCMIFKGGVQ